MGETTKIAWCDMTWNPVIGCQKVSPGCANCYAHVYFRRFGVGPDERRRTSEAYWSRPLAWNRKAEEEQNRYEHSGALPDRAPQRPRVFCGSLCDWLDPAIPVEVLADLLALIAKTPHLGWLLLTKRPGLWRERLEAALWCNRPAGEPNRWLRGTPPDNVWVGTTVEDQQRADERMPELLKIPARVRFLSCEPLLEILDLSPWIGYNPVHESNEQGTCGIRGCEAGLAGDSARRVCLEDGPAQGEQVERQGHREEGKASPCRCVRGRGLPAGEAVGGREAGWVPSPQACMGSLQRADTGRPVDQSQEREEGRQPAYQPGAADPVGECEARLPDRASGRARGEEPRGEAKRFRRGGDSDSLFSRRDYAEEACRGIRSQAPGDFESGQGRQKATTARAHGRLHGKSAAGRGGPSQERARAISLIICGGESGPNARPMHPSWARSLRDQCQAAGVPFLFKQWGEWVHARQLPREERYDDLVTDCRDISDGAAVPCTVYRVGKKAAGRELDGKTWDEFPEVTR